MKRVLGLDIGGANLKMAHTDGTARTVPFELWKQPKMLPAALRELQAAAPPFDELAVTMTGELCDCFESKREGVKEILAAVEQSNSHPIRVWRNDGCFVDLSAARDSPYQIASANWLALVTWSGRLAGPGPALLIDIGSTTTDIIPLLDGAGVPQGRTDAERLRTGELVYRGVRRTPISWELRPGLAAEVFATMHDAFVILGMIPEDWQDVDTADGRPVTKRCAHGRMARMLGEDIETCPESATRELADLAAAKMCEEIGDAIGRVAASLRGQVESIIVAGSGEWLAKEIVDSLGLPLTPGPSPRRGEGGKQVSFVSLNARLGATLSSAACAYAVAVLAAESGDER